MRAENNVFGFGEPEALAEPERRQVEVKNRALQDAEGLDPAFQPVPAGDCRA